MNISAFRSFLGVLLAFGGVFFLFVQRKKEPPPEDAETLLALAQNQMRESQAKNRERAVAAITQKNNLQAQYDQIEKKIARLTERIEAVRQEGNEDGERSLLAEREHYEAILTQTQEHLKSAIETAETVKAAMRREEDAIRARTAQALAMKAQSKQVQIEWEIEKSRLGMTTSHAADFFALAQTKIQQTGAKRDLTIQIRKTTQLLETAAEEAKRIGNETLSGQLLSERNALKEAALNPHLWNG